MGHSVSDEPGPAVAGPAQPDAAAARLAARLLGWPCGFLARVDGPKSTLEICGRRLPADGALEPLLTRVAALGRTVVIARRAPNAGVLEPGLEAALPPSCTGLVAAPLLGVDGEVLGVLGGLDDGGRRLEPAAIDDVAALATLVAAALAERCRRERLAGEASAARARAEAVALRERRLRAALDCLPHFFWVTDAAGRYVEQNASDREAFGDLTGRAADEADPLLEMGALWYDLHRRVLAGETVRRASWRHHPGGEGERWVEAVMAPLVVDGTIEGLVGLTVDRTEEARIATRLEASEAWLRTAIDALPCGLVICDTEGRHVLQNRVDRELWGEAIGKTVRETDVPEEARAHMPAVVHRVLAGETVRLTLRYPCRGERRDVEEIYAPVRTAAGVIGFVGLAIDITDKASAERRLAEAEARLRAAIDALPFPFFICDRDGRHVAQNRLDRELWGDCIGKTFAEIDLPPELKDHVPAALERLRRGLTVHNRLTYARGGRQRHEDEVYAPVVTDGEVSGFVGLAVDLTAQVEQEQRLREREARLADYLDTASEWIWETDAEHRVVAMSGLPASPRLPADRVLGRRRWELADADPSTDPLWRAHWDDLEARRPFRGFVFRLTGVDQAPFWVEINGNPVRDAAGRFLGYRGTGRDVTDRVVAEERLRQSEARLADYLATASDWLWETDAAHRVTSLAGWPADAHLSADRLIGRRRWEVESCDPANDPVWRDHVRDLQARRPFRGFTYAYSSVDHPEIWIELSGNPVLDADGAFLGYRGTARDVTARKRAEAALREAHAKLDAMAQSGLIGMTAGRGFRIEQANAAFLDLLGLEPAAVEGGLDWRVLLAPETVAEEEANASRLAFTGAVYTKEVVYRRADGGRVPVLLNSVVLDGAERRWFALVQDLTPMKLAEARVRELAERDGLTGLANRRVLFERLDGDLTERRRPGTCGAVLLLDLDSFKAVNDSLGHEAGDRLLQIIGARLTAAVRDSDTVARVGGDEFAIILRGLQGPVAVSRVAQKVLDALRQPLALDGRLVRPNGCLGISLFPGDGDTAEALLKRADVALYEAKAKGQGSFCFFEPALLEALEQRRRLTAALDAALGSDAFGIVLQPRVALADGRHVGVEALARWRQDGVELLPAAFIRLAEDSGGIVALGRQLRRLALRVLAELDAAGLAPGTLALNVAAGELKERDFATGLAADLAAHGLSPARIEIEVAEHVLLDRESERVAAGLRELRRLGVSIALDDFGTGYASLTQLMRFPVDRLKIDRSIIRDIGVDADEARLVHGIVRLAHTLGMTVVAEGVETAEQLAFLGRHGCDFAQGRHLAEPLPPSALETYLVERRPALGCSTLPLAQP